MAKKIIDEDSYEFKNARTEDIENYVVDSELSKSSTNPVANSAVTKRIEDIATDFYQWALMFPVVVKARFTNVNITNPDKELGEVLDAASLGHPVFIVAVSEDYKSAIQLPLTYYNADSAQGAYALFKRVGESQIYTYTWDEDGITVTSVPI